MLSPWNSRGWLDKSAMIEFAKFIKPLLHICEGLPVIKLETYDDYFTTFNLDKIENKGFPSITLKEYDQLTLPAVATSTLHKKCFVDVFIGFNQNNLAHLQRLFQDKSSYHIKYWISSEGSTPQSTDLKIQSSQVSSEELYFSNEANVRELSSDDVALYFGHGIAACEMHAKNPATVSCLEHIYSVRFTSNSINGLIVFNYEEPYFRLIICPDTTSLYNEKDSSQHDFTKALQFALALCGDAFIMQLKTYDAQHEDSRFAP